MYEKNEIDHQYQRAGVFIAVITYSVWGIMPAYWKLFESINSFELVCYRYIFTAVAMFVVVFCSNKRRYIFIREAREIFSNARTVVILLCAAIAIAVQWTLFIYMVSQNRIAESSLGYFINPLLNFFLASILLKERLNKLGVTACLLALAGVIVITIDAGVVPWVSLILAFMFSSYGLLKRNVPQQAYTALTLETLFMLPAAIPFLIHIAGSAAFDYTPGFNLLIISSGLVTAAPLLGFSEANRRLSYTLMSFTQYLSPTLSFLVAVFVYKEPCTTIRLLGFAVIWAGIFVFCISNAFGRNKK